MEFEKPISLIGDRRGKHLALLIIAVIILVWVGNLIFFYSQQLAQPIFFRHYYALNVYNDVNFSLYYLANRSLDKEISYIEIPGLEISPRQEVYKENEYSHHLLKQINVTVERGELEKQLAQGDFKFNEIIAHLSSGETITLPVGEINFQWIDTKSPLSNQVVKSSTSNEGYTLWRAESAVKVKAMTYRFKELLGDHLEITLNKKLPLQLEQGDTLKVNYRFLFDDDNVVAAKSYYHIDPLLEVETGNDGTLTVTGEHLTYMPYFTNADIRKFVKQKGDSQ